MNLYSVLEALSGQTPDDYTPIDILMAKPTLDPWAGMSRLGNAYLGDQTATEHARNLVDPNEVGPSAVIRWAESQLGVPYVWATSEPGDSFDCSGFTKWVLSRAGVEVPHMASLQQQTLARVNRDNLAVGDLVFFNYGRKAAGVADHVGVYVGDGEMIDASSSEGEVVRRPVDWEHFIGGGSTGLTSESAAPKGREERPSLVGAPDWAAPLFAMSPGSTMAHVFGSLLAPQTYAEAAPGGNAPTFRGPNAKTKEALWLGFMDAGRPDLANMVKTRAFDSWIRAESSWNVDSVSQPYNVNGIVGVNGGLFQIRYPAHDWSHQYFSNGNSPNGSFTATAYEQAKLIARYFPQLTATRIREYAQQIRSGTYHGWG